MNLVTHHRWIAPICIALLGFFINVIVATSMAETMDEHAHVDYGVSILKGVSDRSSRIDFDSKMPVSVLNAMPRAISRLFRRFEPIAKALLDFRTARYATVFVSFGLCLLVYLYAESLYGRAGGLLAQFLYVISPNLIAHGTLATTDLYIAATTILFLYCFRRFLLNPRLSTAAVSAAVLALAQLTKFAGVYLYPGLLLYGLVILLRSRYRQDACPLVTKRQIGMFLALHALCFFVIVNAGFLFDRTFTPLSKYSFQSETFRRIQQVPVLRSIPLPVPYPYVQGFDMMLYTPTTGITVGNIVMLGNVRGLGHPRSDGFAAYYAVAYLLKEPLGMQMLLLLSLWLALRCRPPATSFAAGGLLLTFAAVFLVALSFFNRAQIGIRHILPVLAITVILSGGALSDWPLISLRRRMLIGGCLLWALISVGSYFPHMIPYFNEIVLDRKLAYRYLSDSNLHWDQETWVVQKFLRSNPDVILDPPTPVTGRVLVNGNLIGGVRPNKGTYWLRQLSLTPVAQVGYGYFLFDVQAVK